MRHPTNPGYRGYFPWERLDRRTGKRRRWYAKGMRRQPPAVGYLDYLLLILEGKA